MCTHIPKSKSGPYKYPLTYNASWENPEASMGSSHGTTQFFHFWQVSHQKHYIHSQRISKHCTCIIIIYRGHLVLFVHILSLFTALLITSTLVWQKQKIQCLPQHRLLPQKSEKLGKKSFQESLIIGSSLLKEKLLIPEVLLL